MMKKILSLTLLFLVGIVIAQNASSLTFEKTRHDLGDMKQGDKKSVDFSFTNTGQTPVVIEDVIVQCGCTATEWPKEPIHPNETNSILITFDSKGKEGIQRKTITVVTNTGDRIGLKIFANVVK